MASGDVATHPIVDGIGVPMPQQPRPQWVVDERDSFISWLRGEFAAANAIIDALCQHLHTVGAPGEYDLVLASIHHRRFNWSTVLHMQQYYSVAEVIMSLHQASLRKQEMLRQSKSTTHDEAAQLEQPPGNFARLEGEKTQNGKVPDGKQASGDSRGGDGHRQRAVNNFLPDKLEDSDPPQTAMHKLRIKDDVKSVVGMEQIEGQQVNVLEGFEIRETVLDSKEAADLAALAKQWSASKNNSKGSKRSSSKDSIQFGTIPSEILAKEEKPSTCFREETAEPIPAFLQSVSDRLAKLHVIPADKPPDSCSISVLEPGDYVPPHSHQSFDPPMFILSVESESTLAFGTSLKVKNAGDIDGPFKLTLSPGSVLLLQEKNAQIVQCAVTPSEKLRILVTFGRMPRRPSTAATATTAAFSLPSSRVLHPPAIAIESLAFMHGFPPLRPVTPPPTLLPVPTTIRSPGPQVVQPNAPLPVFPANVVAPPAAAWSSSPPRVPTTIGTGVFLPPNGTVVYSHMNSSSAQPGSRGV